MKTVFTLLSIIAIASCNGPAEDYPDDDGLTAPASDSIADVAPHHVDTIKISSIIKNKHNVIP